MKHLLKTTYLVGIAVMVIASCKKNEPNLVPSSNNTESSEMAPATPTALGPDLLVTRVNTNLPIVNPSTCGGGSALEAACGSQYTLRVRVTNIGNAATGSPYTLRVRAGGGNFDFNSPNNTLAPGASETFTIGPAPFSSCSGVWARQSILTFADIYNVINETNEGNNRSRPYYYCGD